MSIDTMHAPETRKSGGLHQFGAGFGLGLMVIPAAFVVGFNAGVILGWAALSGLTLAAALIGARNSGQRAFGVLTGEAAFLGGAFLVLAPLLADL